MHCTWYPGRHRRAQRFRQEVLVLEEGRRFAGALTEREPRSRTAMVHVALASDAKRPFRSASREYGAAAGSTFSPGLQNVLSFSCGEAPRAGGQRGAPRAATKAEGRGSQMQAV